jgi:hypothetical protein
MSIAGVHVCTCPLSPDALVCAQCGGTLSTASGILSKIDIGVQEWFYELDNDGRLNPTLTMYMVLDRQIGQGVPATAAVQHAVKEIGKSLSEHGKSISEIESRLTQATMTLQTCLTALRLPGVKGEEGELNVLRELQDAFLGQSCVRIEPIGGPDATDVLGKFFQGEVEIGRSLVEVKSRKTWSTDYLEQVRNDMKRYNAPLAVLVVDKLPKAAKAQGFHVDTESGVIVTTPTDLVVPALTMFYEIHAASYRLQKRTLDLELLAADQDLVHYVNDNMKILENCKKISDAMDDAHRTVEEQLGGISARLKDNAAKIAIILAKYSPTERQTA